MIDHRKFIALNKGVAKFMETNKRSMTIEEFIDYSKQFFSDRKFIDNIAKFCIDEAQQTK